MSDAPTIAFLLMDAPYEQARTSTAFRLMDAALRLGVGIRVFAYEGAVSLPMTQQKPHANALHSRSLEEEGHPNPHSWIEALMSSARERGLRFEWVNCGLCVDERGATEVLSSVRRGSPAEFWAMACESDNVLVIPTR